MQTNREWSRIDTVNWQNRHFQGMVTSRNRRHHRSTHWNKIHCPLTLENQKGSMHTNSHLYCLWWHWLMFWQPEQKSSPATSELWILSRCYKTLVVVLIGRRTHNVIGRLSVLSQHFIGCEDCRMWLVYFDPSFGNQMSVCLLLL